jgi:peptidyl-prolyl cis-trans isomerase C
MARRSAGLTLLALLFAGCTQKAGASQSGNRSGSETHAAVVARVGKVEISEEDLKRAMARDPGASPARFETKEGRRELIDGLIRFELLAQAAERAGLTKDPDAVHAMQQIAVTKLVNQALGAAASPEATGRDEIEREYLAKRDTEFTVPAAAQVRHIRVSDEAQAQRLAARARALAPSDDAAFVALVTANSEDVTTRSRGGDLGFIDKSSHLPAPLVEAALQLKTPGDVAGPIRTDAGYEILRLATLRAAAVTPMSSVEELIRQRLYRERRAKALDAFLAKLREQTPVELVEKAP